MNALQIRCFLAKKWNISQLRGFKSLCRGIPETKISAVNNAVNMTWMIIAIRRGGPVSSAETIVWLTFWIHAEQFDGIMDHHIVCQSIDSVQWETATDYWPVVRIGSRKKREKLDFGMPRYIIHNR